MLGISQKGSAIALPGWHPPGHGAEVEAIHRSRATSQADTLTLGLDQAPPADARFARRIGRAVLVGS